MRSLIWRGLTAPFSGYLLVVVLILMLLLHRPLHGVILLLLLLQKFREVSVLWELAAFLQFYEAVLGLFNEYFDCSWY
ncbi:hypothetical protein BDZ91DRAFT_708347 [Kalaharituber pfeilii]|nr:hypothetical protein BDZ91DRAFT_708347 [Kalaharituber pfeilii]